MTRTDVDVAVVGAGLMGAAAAWALATRGRSVTVLEQHTFNHAFGSSHGSARIVRRAYSDPLYVRMTGEALGLWQQLEKDSDDQLLRTTGGIDFGALRDPAAIAAVLATRGVAHELLSADEATPRWPGIVFDGPVLFHPQAGTVDAEGAVATFLRLAGNAGASLLDRTPVRTLDVGPDTVTVWTDEGPITAGVAVVAAGAWVADLVRNKVVLPPLEVSQQQVFHFRRRDPSVAWPVFVHKDRLSVYGLPGGRDGGPENGQKVAEHDGGRRTTATSRDGRVDPASRERVMGFVRERLPGLDPRPFNEATCLYTTTPDDDFVLDRSGPLVVASPCSGHGAKFAPLIGRMAAGLAVDGDDPEPRFRMDRLARAERERIVDP